jgi:hypothetical protein
MVLIIVSGFYAGRHNMRISGNRMYVHIPAEIVRELSSRRVRVTAVVNAGACNDRRLHNSIISFTATLVKVGATFRLNIPSHYVPALATLVNCATLDIWLAPVS